MGRHLSIKCLCIFSVHALVVYLEMVSVSRQLEAKCFVYNVNINLWYFEAYLCVDILHQCVCVYSLYMSLKYIKVVSE